MKYTFSYIVQFRGGTYCTPVEADDLKASLQGWLMKIIDEKAEIEHLGDKTIQEIAEEIKDEDAQPILLKGLKNIWFTALSTKKGTLHLTLYKRTFTKACG